jgi:CubicO group peptidase (beta-lactamase class C family)
MFFRSTLLLAIMLVLPIQRQDTASPVSDWKTATPESQGLSTAKLDALRDGLAARNTASLLVVRNDRIVCEWYAPGRTAATRHYTASMAKAIVGGVSLAVAMSDGVIALDDPVAKHVEAWRGDPRKSRITVRHLGSHTSGLEDAELDGLPHEKLPGWKGEFWKRLDPPRDPFTLSRDEAAILFEPGQRHQYSNPGIAMLTYAVTAALKNGPNKARDVRTLLRERVMRRIGVPDEEWSAGYDTTFTVDGLALVPAWGGGGYTPRAVAKIGRLMAHRGEWQGHRVISAEAVRLVTSDAGTPAHGGMGWWSNNDGVDPGVPRDAFWGSGAGHQIVLVIPSLNLVAVRNGAVLDKTASDPLAFHQPVRRYLIDPLLDALVDRPIADGTPPYPPSAVIRSIEWAPKASIARQAAGSDNWPLTWADDGALYGAYGDGQGFQPFVPEKLSLGLAQITGGPAAFKGLNLRAPTLERKGDGPSGPKASGLLATRGVLYMWVRNVANSQLAWSNDRGRTWTWADWRFTESFGAPTFLNFGRNYSGARDDYAYIYSPDSETAYDATSHMTLARVPVRNIGQRESYEFFHGLDAQGRPTWHKDIGERRPVFTHAGHAYRSGITYNAPLKRYLWCQVLPDSKDPRGPRFQGGFGVYDAAEPWGPWTTAFFSSEWDVGPGESCSFPTKWMSADGRIAHLVFSGDDAFSVRQAKLAIAR